MIDLLKEVFGMCSHKRISRPVTLGQGPDKETYCVCLECGKHLPVEDWRLVA